MKRTNASRQPARARNAKVKTSKSAPKKSSVLKELEAKAERADAARDERLLGKLLAKELSITPDGNTASLQVPPVPLPVDEYENAPRLFSEKAAIALGLEFVRAYLARTGNCTGKPQSDLGTVFGFANVITYITNLCFRAARGELEGVAKVPNWMAFFLQALGPKAGFVFLAKKLSYSWEGIPVDHTETITSAKLRNELFNASLIKGEDDTAPEPLATGGFRPMDVLPAAYDEATAAKHFAEMNTYLTSDMVALDKPRVYMGIDPTTSGDIYALNLPATSLDDYAGLFDVSSATYRKEPSHPILAQAHFVQKTDKIDSVSDSRNYTTIQGCGGSSVSFFQAQLYSKPGMALAGSHLKKEMLRPVPIMLNEIIRYQAQMSAQAHLASKEVLETVEVPNALEQAVSIYNAVMGFFWNTTRPFSGVALPRDPTTPVGEHHCFIQCDATNVPSSSSRGVVLFYQVVESLRNFFVLCADKEPDTDRTIRRVPAVWQTWNFEPAKLVADVFAAYGIALPPVPTDESSTSLWGQWFSDRNKWVGGELSTLINVTNSPFIDKAQAKYNRYMGALKACSEITGAYPTVHDFTHNKFVRILEVSKISKQIVPELGGDYRFADGTIFTNVKPDIVFGSSSDGPHLANVKHMAQALIPSLPAGVFDPTGLKDSQFNMVLGLPFGINRENGGAVVSLRIGAFVDLTVGNGKIAPTYTSELNLSYFYGRVVNGSGGGFYEVGAKEDWSFIDAIPGYGKKFVKELKAICERKGVRPRVTKRLANACTKSQALTIINRHKAHRSGFAGFEKWVHKLFNIVEKTLDVVA